MGTNKEYSTEESPAEAIPTLELGWPSAETDQQNATAVTKSLMSCPGQLGIIIRFSLYDDDEPARIATSIKGNDFNTQILWIVSLYNNSDEIYRSQHEKRAAVLKAAFEADHPGSENQLRVETSTYNLTGSPEEPVPTINKIIESLAVKADFMLQIQNIGLLAVAEAGIASQLMGFESRTPRDNALHPGAILLSQGFLPGREEPVLSSLRWEQLKITEKTL